MRADATAVTSEAIHEAVAGKTVDIDAPLGTKITVMYRPDGTLTGKAGSLAVYLGSASDKGRWWVLEAPTGQRFCVVHPQRGALGDDANRWG